MGELPDIIRTDIIKEEWDIFWRDTHIEQDETAKTILIVSSPYQPGSSEETQLNKMLQACTLTAAQYRIIRLPEEENISWHRLREKLNPKVVLLVGVLPRQLGIAALLNINAPNRFNDCIWIPTLSVSELEQQPEMKKQLWISGLKPVFVDKSFGDI
jgi:hypothetical protein